VFTTDTDTDPPTSPIWTEDNVDGNNSIYDINGNLLLSFTTVTSAVNYLVISNAATGNSPTITATGTDTNIGITLVPKGSGAVNIGNPVSVDGTFTINGTASQQGKLVMAEDTDNGTNTVTLLVPAAITSDRTVTLPDSDINLTRVYVDASAAGTTSVDSLPVLLVMGNENVDTNNNFASNRFTASIAGTYLVIGTTTPTGLVDTLTYRLYLYKNGTSYREASNMSAASSGAKGPTITVMAVMNLAVSDYLELYGSQPSGGALDFAQTALTVIKLP
jgi:hypothetical protein